MDTFLLELEEIYAELDLNLKEALDAWKNAKFSSDQIKEDVYAKTGVHLTHVEAKFLQRSGKEIFDDNKIFAAFYEQSIKAIDKLTEVERRMARSKIIKLTPEVRKAVERVTPTTYRSKFGSVEWSIVMVDGQPHLARRDTDDSKERLAIPEDSTK